MLLDLATARAHLRLDTDVEDELVQLYLAAAEQSAQQFLNATIFPDEESFAAAREGVTAQLLAAQEVWAAVINAALAAPTIGERDLLLEGGEIDYRRAVAQAAMTMHGLVLTDDIRAAILLTLGHLFSNREDVVAGVSVAQMPRGAQSLLAPYRRRMGV